MTFRPLFADISSNNPQPDINAYARSGHVLLAIKATEGADYVNPYHRGWSLRCGLHHVAVAHYHFARPDTGTTAIREAEWFLAHTNHLLGPRDYVVLDVERGDPSSSATVEWVAAFDFHIRTRTRFRTIIYASQSWANEMGAQAFASGPHRYWVAAWGSFTLPEIPGCEVWAHQFTDGSVGAEPHSLPGIGECDVSRLSPAAYQTVINAFRRTS